MTLGKLKVLDCRVQAWLIGANLGLRLNAAFPFSIPVKYASPADLDTGQEPRILDTTHSPLTLTSNTPSNRCLELTLDNAFANPTMPISPNMADVAFASAARTVASVSATPNHRFHRYGRFYLILRFQ